MLKGNRLGFQVGPSEAKTEIRGQHFHSCPAEWRPQAEAQTHGSPAAQGQR
jgi:hypothetical protein